MIEVTCEAIWPWAFVFWEIFFTASIPGLVIGLFIISLSSWFSLGRLNCSFLPRCLFYCHIVAHNHLYDSLYFCLVCCNLFFFISNFVTLILFSFFLMSLVNGLSILFIFSKNQLLVLLIFSIVSFFSFSFISARILMISFLLLILGFFLFFFSQLFYV